MDVWRCPCCGWIVDDVMMQNLGRSGFREDLGCPFCTTSFTKFIDEVLVVDGDRDEINTSKI